MCTFGAWSEDDWRKDMERKLSRHTIRNGSEHESLAESSHDAWIHLIEATASREKYRYRIILKGNWLFFV